MISSPRLAWLLECALMASILALMVGTACMVLVSADIHAARLEFAAANNEWRRDAFLRLDKLLWKVDTALELGAAARLDLGNLLTNIRAQVKQSTDANAAVSQKQTQAATAAVTRAIETSTRAIQAVAGEPTHDEAPAVADRGVTVNVPPPTVISEKPPEAPRRVEVLERPKRRRRWYSFLWPGNWRP
jgi:hypothetical protein